MAKKAGRKPGKESIGGFFRKVLNERPELLDTRSNAELLDIWETAHGSPADGRIKSNLSNVKSNMRAAQRKQARQARKAQRAAGIKAPVAKPIRNLAMLEEHIDDCMALAKSLDRDALEEVIHHLRLARNKVVWKIGQ